MARASISVKDFKKIPVVGFVPETSGTAPTSPVAGQQWFDSANSKFKYSNDGATFIDPLARTNHTGTQLANTISDFTTAVTNIRISALTAANTPVDFGNQRGINFATPISDTDAANKKYVDDARAGLSVKNPVRVALTANVNINSPGNPQDGVTLATDDRVLLAGQTDGTQNGIWLFKGSTSAMVRSSDADADGEIFDGSLVAVSEGTNANKQFIQTASPAGAPGSWTQTWTVFTFGGQSYTADGQGLEISGTTFSLELDGSTLTKGANGLKVNNVDVASGGTGATTASGARTNIGAAGMYSVALGAVTAGNAVTVTHNLNNQYPTVAVWDVDNAAQVDADVKTTGVNTITVTSALAFASGKLRVTVTG